MRSICRYRYELLDTLLDARRCSTDLMYVNCVLSPHFRLKLDLEAADLRITRVKEKRDNRLVRMISYSWTSLIPRAKLPSSYISCLIPLPHLLANAKWRTSWSTLLPLFRIWSGPFYTHVQSPVPKDRRDWGRSA